MYPTLDLQSTPVDQARKLFNSLDFYYDHGCGPCGDEGGVLIRALYRGLLPCSRRNCVQEHFAFAPDWAKVAVQSGFAEVEHRAFGWGLARYVKGPDRRNAQAHLAAPPHAPQMKPRMTPTQPTPPTAPAPPHALAARTTAAARPHAVTAV